MNNITKRYSIQIFTISVFILLVIVFSSLITKKQLEDSLLNSHTNNLNSLKYTLKINLEHYFDNKTNIIKTISNNNQTKEVLLKFTNAFKELDKCDNEINHSKFSTYIKKHLENTTYGIPNSSNKKSVKEYTSLNKKGKLLQCMYIINNHFDVEDKYKLFSSKQNKKYDLVHKTYHKNFIDIAKRHKFYDIFLIDNDGNIIYSVYKELDFGTNLNDGLYKNSSLAIAYKNSLANNNISFSDFKPYEPSYNEPAAFFSIPITHKNKTIGAIAFQISIDEINNIMTFDKNWENIGLGNSGESYLVGSDYLMRSDSRFFENINNKFVNKLNTTVGILNVKSAAVENALENKNSHGIFKDYRDIKVLSSFTSLKIFDTTWGIIVEKDINEVYTDITNYIDNIIITGLIIILLTILLLIYFLKKFIIKPVEKYEYILENKVIERTKKLNQLNEELKEKVKSQVEKIREKDHILLHQARMAALGEMISNIAHQWRQPLNVISTSISNLKISNEMGLEISKNEIDTTTDAIIKQTDFLSKTIDDFRDFVNEQSSQKSDVNLKDIIKQTIELAKSTNEDIKFILFLEDIKFNCCKNHIVQVILNIIKNSIDAINNKNTEHKYIFITLSKNEKNIKISIKDNGTGINDEMKDKLLDPYTTTKHQYMGTGLGLYMSYQIINNIYNGTIKSKNIEYEYNGEKLLGAEFTIDLPLQD